MLKDEEEELVCWLLSCGAVDKDEIEEGALDSSLLELSADDEEEEALDSFFSELIEADDEEELSIGLVETPLWLSWD